MISIMYFIGFHITSTTYDIMLELVPNVSIEGITEAWLNSEEISSLIFLILIVLSLGFMIIK